MSQDLDEEEDWELEDDEDEDQIINEDPTRQLDVDICPPNLIKNYMMILLLYVKNDLILVKFL